MDFIEERTTKVGSPYMLELHHSIFWHTDRVSGTSIRMQLEFHKSNGWKMVRILLL